MRGDSYKIVGCASSCSRIGVLLFSQIKKKEVLREMKSYLSLIPISARVRKRQNRMTILCITISVLLVTVIFSTVDMTLQGERLSMEAKHGSWHICLNQISQETGDQIQKRQDISAAGWSGKFNENADQPYYIGERKAALYGADLTYMTQLTHSVEEGNFPENDEEILLSSNAKLVLNVNTGDKVTLQTPAGDRDFVISGFGSDEKEYYQGQTYLVAVYMTPNAFVKIMEENGLQAAPALYVQFENAAEAAKGEKEIQRQYDIPEDCVEENMAVMGLAGQSSSEAIKNFYGIAAFLFVLVLLAGVLMISGSMNSNVVQRTKFFGMMRCVGVSRRQIISFVRLETLNWCRTAVPAGLILGMAISSAVCALLHYGIGGEFAGTPVLALSPIGLTSGAAAGVMTVLLAAQAPAKRAAAVSPAAAVSGGGKPETSLRSTLGIFPGRIELNLGIRHATASKKNWILMTASFALSIILFFCFSVGLDFACALVPSLRDWQPDITLNGYANAAVIKPETVEEIRTLPGVKMVFGASYEENVPAVLSGKKNIQVNLVSYSSELLDSAKESVVKGDISGIYGAGGLAATVFDQDNPLKAGDTVQIAGQEVKITCAVSDGLFPGERSLICSRETFEQLTGITEYSLVGIQTEKNVPEETIEKISSMTGSDVIFTDMRERNRQDAATYLATRFVACSFLAIIAMITFFHIVNSISMSASARMKQYGAMRAVGMDGGQLTRMILAEALTYSVSGLIVGYTAGILVSRFLYIRLITRYFGNNWELPVNIIIIAAVFDLFSAAAAVYIPARRIRKTSVTETISEL